MAKGIILGLLYQLTGVVGFILIDSVTGIKSDILKANLIVLLSGVIAFAVVVYFSFSGTENLSTLTGRDWFYLVTGSVLVLVIGYILYIAGLSASNVTTMAYTALAYPAFALILELILGRVTLSTLTVQELAGFAFLAVDYVLLIGK